MRLVTVMLFALLAGCGQKGPLYFAEQEPATAPEPAATQATANDDNDEKDAPKTSAQD